MDGTRRNRDPGRRVYRPPFRARHIGTGFMRENGDTEHDDGTLITDAWWAALVADLLHPIQVQIIEALRWIDQPLSAGDLSETVDDVEPARFDYHLGRLKKLGALDCGLVPPGTGFMDVHYRLVVGRSRRGCR
jgi:DNA-binding transcriptional ArsR family regulator